MKYLTVQVVQCKGPDACETRLDPLMDALLGIEEADSAVTDPDIAANTLTDFVDVQMTVEAASPADAAQKAQATLRAAIHAIGDFTPGWETSNATMHVAPEDAPDRLLAAT